MPTWARSSSGAGRCARRSKNTGARCASPRASTGPTAAPPAAPRTPTGWTAVRRAVAGTRRGRRPAGGRLARLDGRAAGPRLSALLPRLPRPARRGAPRSTVRAVLALTGAHRGARLPSVRAVDDRTGDLRRVPPSPAAFRLRARRDALRRDRARGAPCLQVRREARAGG